MNNDFLENNVIANLPTERIIIYFLIILLISYFSSKKQVASYNFPLLITISIFYLILGFLLKLQLTIIVGGLLIGILYYLIRVSNN